MDFKRTPKSSTPDDKKKSTNIPNHANNEAEELQSTAAESATGTSEDVVNLSNFLDLMNISCQVNDMITNSSEQKQVSINDANTNVISEVDFTKLSENHLVNELLINRKQQRIAPATGDGSVTESVGNAITNANERSRGYRNSWLSSPGVKIMQSTAKSHSPHQPKSSGLHPELNQKLDYVINEGVIDAVLPFVCPVPVPLGSKYTPRSKAKPKELQKKPLTAVDVPSTFGQAEPEKDVSTTAQELRRKSNIDSMGPPPNGKKDLEVVIHVCDELKNTSRDFLCPQALLINKMGYFADITAGQKLEDMDISVHCDLHIFDWLMNWVKRSASFDQTGTAAPMENEPKLDSQNVVPILVSAKFLQMEPLLLDCLSFCHAHLSEVVRTSPNLACLNDALVTRLAAMFTNIELEAVRDKKDRVTPRLWTKLIQSLCEAEPEALRGHYFSLSGLFRCAKCGKCVTNTMKSYISCVPSNVRLNRWGQLVSHHVRDSSWDLSAFISQVFKELKSWRKVYWKLWGFSHFLYCCICETHFPIAQMSWCRFHPEGPNFLGPISEGRAAGPAGRYPCCGQQAFRFETLPGPNGCQFREHNILVETDRERSILSIAQLVSESCAVCENPPVKLQEAVAGGEIESRWAGLSLLPQRNRQGLVPVLNPEESTTKIARRARLGGPARRPETSTDTETSDTFDNTRRCRKRNASSFDTTTSDDGCESDDFNRGKGGNDRKQKKRQLQVSGRYWSGDISARSNQDHQREYEEKVMKQVVAIVTQKIGLDYGSAQNPPPAGGTYVRLEAEWKEQCKQRTATNVNATASTSTSTNATTATLNTGAATKQKQNK